MKRFLLSLLLFFVFTKVLFSENKYRFSVDLTKCVKDKLFVELITPEIKTETVVYRLPKIVPGTYEVLNFGRFVSNLKAFDSLGNEMQIEKLDINSWKILSASGLKNISYEVEDTWDTEIKEPYVFEPAGSNFEEGKNFVLNSHCLFGYFDEMKLLPYQINITRPSGFYGTCSLTDVITKNDVDTYSVSDYMELQDAPMMYNIPDTTILSVGSSEVIISVYSQNKITTSKFIAEQISEILFAQKEYLGGSLPIKKYAYLIYLTPYGGISGASGALEHSYSSMYFLPEMDPKYLAQTIRDVSAHEFFHIVTPLNIHSEQIGNFNYNDPQMSKHLWLYEGATEYASGLVQIKYGNKSVSDYLQVIESKIVGSKGYNDSLPFTVMSEGCLKNYKNQYNNVYQKGALIGLCLDIQLRYLSGGKYGLQELMTDLSKTYGKDKSFKDEELFDQIVKLTYPEIGDFFKNYVEGSKPLPIKKMLELVGVGYGVASLEKNISFGGVSIGLNNASGKLMFVNTASMDDFGRIMGYMEYDELLKFNGKKITPQNVQEVIAGFMKNAKEGDDLTVVVLRKKSENSRAKKIKLKSKLIPVSPPVGDNLILLPSATEAQLKLRADWIGKH